MGLREGRERPTGLGESENGAGGERTWAWGHPQPRACSIPGRLPGGLACFPQGGSLSLPTCCLEEWTPEELLTEGQAS